MREEAVTFGTTNLLVGVFTEPDDPAHKRGRPAVILLNAGLLHRVGPYRLYVDLARRLSSLGFTVFRFDLSGVGDSLQGNDARLYDERVVDNIREAMDLLNSTRGVSDFVLMGLCAGADNAHKAAVRDGRVRGAVYFDGYGYRTWGYYLHRYGPKLFNIGAWIRFIKGKVLSVASRAIGKTEEVCSRGQIFARSFPPKAQVANEIQALVKRGVNLLYVFSGGVKYSYFNYRGQFKAMYHSIDFLCRAECIYFAEAEHTFPSQRDRERLVTTVCYWMQKHFQPSIS
jgi:dienelactone hydrolase